MEQQTENLDELMDELQRERLTQVPDPNPDSGLKYSTGALDHYDTSRSFSHETLEELQETANEVVSLDKKIKQQEKINQSPLLKNLWNTKNNIMRYVGMPQQEITQQDLLEEKMRLSEQYKNQALETRTIAKKAWNDTVVSKDKARVEQIEAGNTQQAAVEQLKKDNELYEEVSQQLKQTKKMDPEYLPLVRAKDELRRRIAIAEATYVKACGTIVNKEKIIKTEDYHERFVLSIITQLECAAKRTEENINLINEMHSLQQLFKEGKKQMQLYDLIQSTTAEVADLGKDAKEISDMLERTALKNEKDRSAFDRMNSRIGEYGSRLRNTQESGFSSLERRALDIMNSYGE